jgi:hypothetical protein
MKRYLIILAGLLSLGLDAQENAQDYILPAVNNRKVLYQTFEKNLNADLADMEIDDLGLMETYDYHGIYQADGSVSYKMIRYEDASLFGSENYAYFLKFSGSTASLAGYSSYDVETNLFFDEVVNEQYKPIEGTTMYKVPNESYQSLEWTFTDPYTKASVNASSYYKTMSVNDYEKRILVVEFKSGGKTRKEYYLKYFGLVAIQTSNMDYYVTDLHDFLLYSKTFLDGKTEPEIRKIGWDIISRLRAINKDSVSVYNNNRSYKLCLDKMDSLNGLYEHLMIRNPELKNPYRYIINTYLYNLAFKFFEDSNGDGKLDGSYNQVMRPISNYYFLRPYAEAIDKAGLSTYITGVDEYYYLDHWLMAYYSMKTIFSKSSFTKEYKAYLEKPIIEEILKSESKIDNKNKCILYSYVSNYYYYIGDEEKRYFYLVKYVEYFKFLTPADKDLNIEYMRGVMSDLSSKMTPANDSILTRAVTAVLELKDYSNAIKIADNGLRKGIGHSLAFGMGFAEAAYMDDVNKEYLRKAMKILENKYGEMNVEQINRYLVYCRAMSPEFDCRKAEAEVSKAQKREKEEQQKKEKQQKKSGSSSYSSSSEKKVNFAIAGNPVIGLNFSGNGRTLNYLPLSAELRTGGIAHEFRVNTFFGLNAKNRFIGGKVLSDAPDLNREWKNIKGADYSYGIFFMKNDISSYSRSCVSTGGGLQFLAGQFTTDPENLIIRQNNLTSTITVNPNITRYEALLNFKLNMFNWKSHLFFTMFYGAGAGVRSIKYNSNLGFTEADLKNKDKITFEDRRYIQDNWTGAYFTFRGGFRFGFTIF